MSATADYSVYFEPDYANKWSESNFHQSFYIFVAFIVVAFEVASGIVPAASLTCTRIDNVFNVYNPACTRTTETWNGA